MKRIIFYLLVQFLSAAGGHLLVAQPDESLHVRIELINNQNIQGQLIMPELPVILSVYLSPNDSMAVPTRIIRRITFEKETGKEGKKIRYFNNTLIGILSGRSNSQASYRSEITAEMINGIRFTTWCWTGLGVAFDQYPELSILPVFFSLRGDLLQKTFTPFYFFDIGSGPSWVDENQFTENLDSDAGLVFHFGGGLRVYASPDVNIMIALGFKNQEVEITRQLWGGQEEVSSRNFKNFSFRIGVGF